MILSKTMEDAINERDMGRIYSSFYTILLSDPGFVNGKFDETLNELKKRGIQNLFQSYNGKPFKEKEDWDQQYWDTVASELMDNFCIERINHLKSVSNFLYPSATRHRSSNVPIIQQSNKKKTVPIHLYNSNHNSNIGKLIAAVAIIIVLIIIVVLAN